MEAATTSGLPDWVTVATGVIIALGGGGGVFQLMRVRADRRAVLAGTEKARAEAADILSDAAVGLLAPLREELTRMQERVTEGERRMRELEETLVRERRTADTRIRQLELEIVEREREIAGLRRQLGP